MKKLFFIIILFIPSIALSTPVSKKYTTLPAPVSSASIEKGRALYQENGCAMCHGDQGQGDGPLASGLANKPRNFRDYDEMKRMPTIRMEQAIHNGLKGTAMPAFDQFSESQIESLTSYLRSFLVDSYTTLKMCAHQTYVIEANDLKKSFSVEADQPDKFEVKVIGKNIHFRGKNWPELLNQKVHRTHFRVIQNKNITSLISVQIQRCDKEVIDLLKTLPMQKADMSEQNPVKK